MGKKTPKSGRKTLDPPSTPTTESETRTSGNPSTQGEPLTMGPIGGEWTNTGSWRFLTTSNLFKQMADDGYMDDNIKFCEKKGIPHGILEISGRRVALICLPEAQDELGPPELSPQVAAIPEKEPEKVKEKKSKGKGKSLFKDLKKDAEGTLDEAKDSSEVTKPGARISRKRVSVDFTGSPSPKRVTRSQKVHVQHIDEPPAPPQIIQEKDKDESMNVEVVVDIHLEANGINGNEENKKKQIQIVDLEDEKKGETEHGDDQEKEEAVKDKDKVKELNENKKNEKKEDEDKKNEKKEDENKKNEKKEDEGKKNQKIEDDNKKNQKGEDEEEKNEEQEDEEDRGNDSDEEDSLNVMKQIMALANASDNPAEMMLEWLRTMGIKNV